MNINNIDLSDGFRMIEASAGTGKTFTLSHLALRKIIEGETKPEELLIISFTRKSANDLRSKIIERFKLLKSYICNEIKVKDIDETLKNWYENNCCNVNNNKMLELLENIIENPKIITITTIDGLFKRIHEEHNLYLDTSPKLKIENNLDNIYKNIIDQLWIKDYLNLEVNIIKSIEKKELNIGNRYGKRINKKFFRELLKTIDNDNSYQFKLNYQNYNSTEISRILKDYIYRSWIKFYNSWSEEGNKLYDYLLNIGNQIELNGNKNRIYKPKNRKYTKNNIIIENINKEFNKENIGNILFEITKDDDISKYFYLGYLKGKIINHQLFYDEKKFTNLQNDIYNIKYGFFNKFIKIFICNAIKLLEIRKKEVGILKSNDITKLLIKKLISTESRDVNNYKKLDCNYKAIFIDEFQDTDNSQWEIIKYLFKDNNHLLITVGDPKQAIYKFRGGDINTYLNAKTESNKIYYLDNNYRSSPELLSILNKLYEKGLVNSKLEYKKLTAKKDKNLINNPYIKNPFNVINFSKDEKNIEELVISYLFKFIDKNNFDLDKIALLTRTNKQCEILKIYFKRFNIPYQITSKLNIFDTEASRLIKIFLDFLLNPYSSKKLLLLATSKLVEFNSEEINNENPEEIIEFISEKCLTLASNLHKEGFLSMIYNLIYIFKSKSIINDKNLLNDLLQLSEIIELELIKKNYNIKIINDWFNNELEENKRTSLTDDFISKSNSKASGINICTIHSSKGLEYDVVICPYLWNKSEDYNGPLWKDIDKKEFILNIDCFHSKVQKYYEYNNSEEIKETERLIYVALTRAKYKLILFNNTDNPVNNLLENLISKTDNKNIYFKDSNLFNFDKYKDLINKENIENNYSINLNNVKNYRNYNFEIKYKKLNFISSYSSWIKNTENKFNFESIYKDYEDNFSFEIENKNSAPLDINDINNKANPLSSFPKGINAGICLHKIIEKYNFQSDNKEKLDLLIKKELKNFNIDPGLLNNVKEGLKRIINSPLGIELNNKRLIDIPEKEIIKELKYDLSLSYKGKIITSEDIEKCFYLDENHEFGKSYSNKVKDLDIYSKGFHSGCIDCIIPVGENIENSKWWIIDWKSNYISNYQNNQCLPQNYNYENMKKEMVKHHYPLQSHLYLLALHRFLKWRLPNYSPQNSLGGYLYIFIRGLKEINENKNYDLLIPGMFTNKVPINRILYLDKLFKNEH